VKKLPFLVVIGSIAAGAVVHGAVTQRWSVFSPDAARTERMHALVVRYPGFESSEVPHDVPLKERSTATSRRYEAAADNMLVVTSMISGIPGAVATHTPDVCYSGSGYTTLRGPKRETVALPGGRSATFLVADFERRRAASVERQRVRWAWTADGTWDAPDYARFHYMNVPELFKLYVVTPLPVGDAESAPADDPPPVKAFVAAAFAQYAAAMNGN
jgi:hypothetical protein